MSQVVIIPLYKSNPSDNELASFVQCNKILKSHDICIIAPYGFKPDMYLHAIDGTVDIECFAPHYFSSIEEYSELMKSFELYHRFRRYDYILVYQLDAWVFADELEYWCSLGYDYIGAPWLKGYSSFERDCDKIYVGNGGLSLRRTKKFLEITNPRTLLASPKEIFQQYFKHWYNLPLCMAKCLGYHNKIKRYSDQFWGINEDYYFCVLLSSYSNVKLKMPDIMEAAMFSFDENPETLYEMTGNKLPFACHAWEKNNPDFWADKLKI